jgi:8-oxo-dGTP pyrophosphatase MutT (NUDIX family)
MPPPPPEPPDIDQVEDALREQGPAGVEIPRDAAEAAVAIVLTAIGEQEPALLLIERARHPHDPWSGHIGLPGGRREPVDPDRIATAIRETAEEVRIALDPGQVVGSLPPIQARRRGVLVPLWVEPVVFRLERAIPPQRSLEVAASRWVPFRELLHPRNGRDYLVETPAGRRPYPAVRLDRWTLWGLTYRMLDDLFRLCGRKLPGQASSRMKG